MHGVTSALFLLLYVLLCCSARSESLHSSSPPSGLPDAPEAQFRFHYDQLSLVPVTNPFRSLPEEVSKPPDPIKSNFRIMGVTVGAARNTYLHYAPSSVDLAISSSSPPEAPLPERYHWGGLIGQSILFNVIENSFRIASDDQIRTLLVNKPFWHDYVASMGQFNMRRWNDGDSFIVNYIGHPMQGAISGYIEIQNDPQGRALEISATRAYWQSRFKAFLWATVYSTHSEISPLGEAGIGNEGGWTYPLNCSEPCSDWKPGHKYTNNTGWVDFIVTPTIGMLWILGEDTLDRYVSDRVAGGDQSRWANKIVRGVLNPSKTFANFTRGKLPWYRDSPFEAELKRHNGIHFSPSEEQLAERRKFRRYEIAAHFRMMPLGGTGGPCEVCVSGAGGGVEFNYGLTRWLRASVALDKQQGTPQRGSAASGSALNGSFGLRLEHNGLRHNVALAIRPGVLLERVTQPAEKNFYSYGHQHDSTVHNTVTFLLSSDYKVSPTFGFRSSIGATVVRYLSPVKDAPGIGKPPYLSWLSHDNFVNRSAWICEFGPVYRF